MKGMEQQKQGYFCHFYRKVLLKLGLEPKDQNTARKLDEFIQDRSVKIMRGMLVLYLILMFARLGFNLNDGASIVQICIFIGQGLVWLLAMQIYRKGTSIYMAIFTISLNYYFVILFDQGPPSEGLFSAFLNGERISLLAIIAIIYINSSAISLIILICYSAFRFYEFRTVEAWQIFGLCTNFLLILSMRILDLRTLTKNFSERDKLFMKNESFYKLIEHHMPEGIAIMMKLRNIVAFENQGITRLLNQKIVDHDLEQRVYIPEKNPKGPKSSLAEVIRNASEVSQNYIGTNDLMESVFRVDKIGLSVVSAQWEGEEAVILRYYDMTEHDKLLTMEATEKSRDRAVAVVSHELRTPLNAILGMLGSLNQMVSSPEQKNIIEICTHSAKMLLTLVNSILDYEQIKNQKIKFHFETVDLGDILEDIKSLLRPLVQAKGIDLVISKATNVPSKVYMDRPRVQQVITNLVGNAAKFTFKGVITIKVDLDNLYPHMLEFQIIDTGVGIDKTKVSTLFNDYTRIDEHDEINKSGVGLGLSISQSIVKTMASGVDQRGIRVESEVGKGSKFIFSVSHMLPINLSTLLEYDHTLPELGEETVTDQLVHQIRSLRLPSQLITLGDETDRLIMKNPVLIVDDNPFNITILLTMLKEFKLAPLTASNGQECLDVLEKCSRNDFPKLLLLDCFMPIMDGYETAKILQTKIQEGKIPKIYIVALTAQHIDRGNEGIVGSHMDDCLSKPITKEKLEGLLRKCKIIEQNSTLTHP